MGDGTGARSAASMFDARERFIRCRGFLCWRLLWITGIVY